MSMSTSTQTFDETQHPRDPRGQFTTRPAGEVDVELGGPVDPNVEASRELAALQELTADPATGASPPLWRHYSWHDEETGDFAVWAQDLTNTAPDRLSEEAIEEWALVRDGLDAGETPEAIAARLGTDPDDPELDEEADPELVAQLTRLKDILDQRTSTDPLPEGLHDIVAQRRAHEAEGGTVHVDMHTGETSWRDSADDRSQLFRASAQPDGAPAHFDADGTPRVWVRGNVMVAADYTDGSSATFHYPTGAPTSHTSADGSVERYDPRTGERHATDGPAVDGPEQVGWYRQGDLHRDLDEGPAKLSWTGEVEYVVAGRRVDPTPEQAAAHGVEAFADQLDDEWSVVLDNPGDTTTRYRAVGSDPDSMDGESTFDWSGHPARGTSV